MTYANIVASVALFMALGGVSYAAKSAAKNSVTTISIKNGGVRSADLGRNAVTSVKIKDGQVRGADILESSLGKVPSAAKADRATNAVHATNADVAANANTLGGLAPTAFVQKSELPAGPAAPGDGPGAGSGTFGCAGSAWESVVSTATYAITGSEKHGTSGAPMFRCSVSIPDGAMITAVNFAVADTSLTDNADCDLWRTNMVTAVGGELLLATAATEIADIPGNVQIAAATVTQPLVDNVNYSYFLQCTTGPDSTTGVFGATIAYSSGAAAGLAAKNTPAPAASAGSSSAR